MCSLLRCAPLNETNSALAFDSAAHSFYDLSPNSVYSAIDVQFLYQKAFRISQSRLSTDQKTAAQIIEAIETHLTHSLQAPPLLAGCAVYGNIRSRTQRNSIVLTPRLLPHNTSFDPAPTT